MLKKYSPYILLVLVNFIYGANYTIAKAVMPQFIGPYGFIVYRVFGSLLLFIPIFLIFFREKISKSDLPRIFACGFFGIAANQLLFFKGISLTSTIHASLLMITTPIITFIVSNILLKEKFAGKKLLGISIGMTGAAILVLTSVNNKGNANIFGDLCVMLNAVCFSIYLIVVKPLMKKYHPLTVTFLCFLTGSIWVALSGLQQALSVDFHLIPSYYYWNFAFVIFFATFVVYLFNIIAIRSVSATTVSSFMYLQPLFAIIISIIFTGERLSLSSSLGGILIIFGLWLINLKK